MSFLKKLINNNVTKKFPDLIDICKENPELNYLINPKSYPVKKYKYHSLLRMLVFLTNEYPNIYEFLIYNINKFSSFDINYKSDNAKSIFESLIESPEKLNAETIQLLLENGVIIDKKISILNKVCDLKIDPKIIKLMIEHYLKLDMSINVIFYNICSRFYIENIENVIFLIKMGANVHILNGDNISLSNNIAIKCTNEEYELLISTFTEYGFKFNKNICVNKGKKYPDNLLFLCTNDNHIYSEKIKILLKYGVNVFEKFEDVTKMNIFEYACIYGKINVETIKILLNHINFEINFNELVMMICQKLQNHTNLLLFNYLLQYVDINYKNKHGNNYLSKCCIYNNSKLTIEAMSILINKGININSQNNVGKTCIMEMYNNFNTKKNLIYFLIDNDIDLNIVEYKNGENFLMMISKVSYQNKEKNNTIYPDTNLMERIISKTNLNTKNFNGFTVHQIALPVHKKLLKRSLYDIIDEYDIIVKECMICYNNNKGILCKKEHFVCFKCIRALNKNDNIKCEFCRVEL